MWKALTDLLFGHAATSDHLCTVVSRMQFYPRVCSNLGHHRRLVVPATQTWTYRFKRLDGIRLGVVQIK